MLSDIELRTKNLDRSLTIVMCKLLKCNMALQLFSFWHKENNYDVFWLTCSPTLGVFCGYFCTGSKIILSVLITQNSLISEFYLLIKLTTVLSTYEMFCLCSFHSTLTHSFHLLYKYGRFLLSSTGICM